VVEGIGVNHDERQPFAGDFVIDLYAVGGAVHRLRKSVPSVPAVPIVPDLPTNFGTTGTPGTNGTKN
jgi:hypothetical protein